MKNSKKKINFEGALQKRESQLITKIKRILKLSRIRRRQMKKNKIKESSYIVVIKM